MSSEEPKVKVTIERENVEPVELEVNAIVCAGDTDDGVLVFTGGYMTQYTALGVMRRLVSESVRVMVNLGIDETEAREQLARGDQPVRRERAAPERRPRRPRQDRAYRQGARRQ